MTEPAESPDCNVLTIPIEQVRCRKDHIRKSAIPPDTLRETIEDAGLLQPILVCRAEDGAYDVIDGVRRLDAIRELGIRDLILGREIIIDVEEREADVRFKQVIANVQREDLNPVELGQAFVTLKEECGYQYNEIAAIIGKTPHYVAAKVGLIKRLDPEVRHLYLREVEAIQDQKGIQSTSRAGQAPCPLNVNVLEDIARVPRDLQRAAYGEIRNCKLDKDKAIAYLRELKEKAGPPASSRSRINAPIRGRNEGAILTYIRRIDSDIRKLAESVKGEGNLDPGLASDVEALIRQLCMIYTGMLTEEAAGRDSPTVGAESRPEPSTGVWGKL